MLMEDIFQDKEKRYPLDDAIRQLGYQIYRREKGKEAVWCKRSAVARAMADVTGEYAKAQNAFVYFTQTQIIRKHGVELEKIMEQV